MDTAGLHLTEKWVNSAHGNPLSPVGFRDPDTHGDVLRGNTREFSMQEDMQSSVYRGLCSSVSPMSHEGPISSHCDGTSEGTAGSEPGELPTSVFLPFVANLLQQLLWKKNKNLFSLECKCRIRYLPPFTHLSNGCGLCIQICWRDPSLTTPPAAAPTNQKTPP